MPGKIDLFKAALGNEAYLTEINYDSHTQHKFIETLEENQFTPSEIIELIHIVNEPRVHTLLILRLLGQHEYLDNLKGESVLSRLAYKEEYVAPSRLNAWVHQLDITVLSPELINKLAPEAAVSILCSIPHFHQLTAEQIQALLHKHLSRELIFYWVRHYAYFPNAYHVLAHLMKLIYTEVIDAIKEQNANRKTLLITNIIEHLHVFHPLPKKFLTLANQESHLILAMKLYLNGHYYQAYTSYIKQLTDMLLHNQHVFSQEATELFFTLEEVSELKSMKSSIAELTNAYFGAHLKINAQQGNIRVLYHDNALNVPKITQTIHLQSVLLTTGNRDYHITNAQHEMNTVFNEFIKSYQTINFFEYYLIHYCGERTLIEYALNDYLHYCIRHRESVNNIFAIQRLIFLLSCTPLDIESKQALFTALLNHSHHYSERVLQKLFLYNPLATLQHFGLQGGKNNYQIVHDLSSWALSEPSLANNQQLIQIAQQAQAEAELELTFCEQQGLFANLIKYLKRCWIYGWTGFFSPLKPLYVCPESNPPKHATPHTSASIIKLLTPKEKDLHTLLNEMQSSNRLTQEHFINLIAMLNQYSLKDLIADEFAMRIRIHKLFNSVIQHHDQYYSLYTWLKCNQGPFMDNHFRLIELSFQEYSRSETDSLIQQITDGPDKLMRIAHECNCDYPQQNEMLLPLQNASADVHQLVTTTTETLNQCSGYVAKAARSTWGWVNSITNSFFTNTATAKPPEAPQGRQSTSTAQL